MRNFELCKISCFFQMENYKTIIKVVVSLCFIFISRSSSTFLTDQGLDTVLRILKYLFFIKKSFRQSGSGDSFEAG